MSVGSQLSAELVWTYHDYSNPLGSCNTYGNEVRARPLLDEPLPVIN